MCAEKMQEFITLRQGQMTVAKYATKFEELTRFSPAMVPIDEVRKSKFMHRLCTKIVKYVDARASGP